MDIDAQRHSITAAIERLPHLDKNAVALDDSCPICLVSFDSIFDAKDTSAAGSSGVPVESGVTKIEECGHIFCRKDLVEWISGMHGTCPTCRHPFLDIKPSSDSDDESSDGGEYLPDQIDTDGLTESEDYDEEEYEREMMELDSDNDSEAQAYYEELFVDEDVDFEEGDSEDSSIADMFGEIDVAIEVQMDDDNCEDSDSFSEAADSLQEDK